MAVFIRRHHTVVRVLAVGLIAFVSPIQPSYSQPRTPSGTIQFDVVSGGFIIGGSGGSETLVYQGKQYPLSIGGLSVGLTIGLAKTELIGRVYNLRNVSDIAGTYTAGEAGFTVAGGRKIARLRNSKGVFLRLRGRQIGLEATIDLSGMEIWLR